MRARHVAQGQDAGTSVAGILAQKITGFTAAKADADIQGAGRRCGKRHCKGRTRLDGRVGDDIAGADGGIGHGDFGDVHHIPGLVVDHKLMRNGSRLNRDHVGNV